MVALYPSETPWPVYCAPCWWSDGWDAKAFALAYDPDKPFFEQYRELQIRVPRIGLLSINSVNSEYTNNSADNKNCYLLFAGEKCEDCYYGRFVQHCKSVMDTCYIYESELCYECVDCQKCYNVLFSERCQASSDLLLCFDVRDSDHCILSTNLRRKSYCILNKQCSKEKYERKKKEILSSYQNLRAAQQELEKLKSDSLVKNAFQTKCKEVTGDYLFNCHEGRMLFDTRNAKHCAYLADTEDPIDCWDGNNMYYKPELCLDIMGALQDYNCKYSMYVFYCSDVEYSDNCHNCESCFGCIGLRKGKNSILNKEYSKEEYAGLKAQIIDSLKKEGLYGAFFPPQISPFGYNETLAKEFWPLEKEKALAQGFKWAEGSTGTFGKETIPFDKMPNTIEETKDSIVNEILKCEVCGKNFRITPMELDFYRRLHLPLPRKDFEYRHHARMNIRVPRMLVHRKCQCAGKTNEKTTYINSMKHFHGNNPCSNEFETSYTVGRPETVYCEECYQAEIA